MNSGYTTPADTRIGHVLLKAPDLDRAHDIYRDLLGFELMTMYGENAAFISAGGYHHHIGLNSWHSKGGKPAPKSSPGLYHAAILYPMRKGLAQITRRLIYEGYPIDGARDRGVSEATYLTDPVGSGAELYRNRPHDEWKYSKDESVKMYIQPLNLRDLLSELEEEIKPDLVKQPETSVS